MKTSALSRLVIILLIVPISCTKESNNIAPITPAATQNSSDALAESLDNDVNQLPIVGKWTLYYTWNCVGDTGSTKMTVKADGTYTIGEGYSGSWVKGRRIFLFTFNHSETTYSGIIFDNKIRGIMTTFDHTFSVYQGCFYMIPDEGSNLKNAHIPGTLDASGKKQ